MDEHVPVSEFARSQKQSRFIRPYARLAAAIWRRGGERRRRGRLGLGDERGQAILEYILVLIMAFTFTHQVFFNSTWGFKTILQNTMLRLGSFLEANLKTGTKVAGGDGKFSLDPFAGTDRWSN